MTAIGAVIMTAPKIYARASPDVTKPNAVRFSPLNATWKRRAAAGRLQVVRAVPDKLSEKVEESIKNAQDACSDDPVSGECAAAWDEVEELSAAASHARDKEKVTDALEDYCKDNPETDECRTYDN